MYFIACVFVVFADVCVCWFSVHGSATSLISGGSSLYGSSQAEDRQANEVRRLKRELVDAREQVLSLSSQLSSNVSRTITFNLSNHITTTTTKISKYNVRCNNVDFCKLYTNTLKWLCYIEHRVQCTCQFKIQSETDERIAGKKSTSSAPFTLVNVVSHMRNRTRTTAKHQSAARDEHKETSVSIQLHRQLFTTAAFHIHVSASITIFGSFIKKKKNK